MDKADPKRLREVADGRRFRVSIRCLECGIVVRGIEQASPEFEPELRSCSSPVCETLDRVFFDLTRADTPETAQLFLRQPGNGISSGRVILGASGLVDRARRVLSYLVDEDLDWPLS